MTFIAADFQLEEIEEEEKVKNNEFWLRKAPRRGKPILTPESKQRQDQSVRRLLEAIEEQEKKSRRNHHA